MSDDKSEARKEVERVLSRDSELAYAFRKIGEMGEKKSEEQKHKPAPAQPARSKSPQVIRERKEPQLIKEEPIPQPISIKPEPTEVHRQAAPQPHQAAAPAKPQIDQRLVEVARLWGALSDRDRTELLFLARMKAKTQA